MVYKLMLDHRTVAMDIVGTPHDAEQECRRLVSTVSGRHAQAVVHGTGREVARADFDDKTGEITSKRVPQ